MIEIYEDVLPAEMLASFREGVLGKEMPWFYISNSAYMGDKKELDQGSLFHLALEPSVTPSPWGEACLEVANQCAQKLKNSESYEVFRARFGLQMWKGSTPVSHGAHVDCGTPHIVGLLYLNDSDGDTIIYHQEQSYTAPSSLHHSRFTEKCRVSPRANRLVLFDGKYFHSSSAPVKHANRYVLNLNWASKNNS